MDIVHSWINSGIIFIITLFGFLLKGYMKKKGEGFASKEDIAEITRKTEEVKTEFKVELDRFRSDLGFKYKYYNDQLIKLYTVIYSIVCQSEYLRIFFRIADGTPLNFDEVPFIEINKSKKTKKMVLDKGRTKVEHDEQIITDSITEYSKLTINTLILDNSHFASQKLLKLSVAYRFVHMEYSGTTRTGDSHIRHIADDQELILIKEIVRTIIQDYNFLRKELRMPFSEFELESGIFEPISIE